MSQSRLNVSLDDLREHVITFGMDIFPPLELAREQVRAQGLFQDVKELFPDLFQQLILSDTEFRIRRTISSPGRTITLDTLVWTPRGPVVTFCLRHSGSATGDLCTAEDAINWFNELREILFRDFPGRQILRIGLIREVIFSTGNAVCTPFLGTPSEFAGTKLIGGTTLSAYADGTYNVRISYKPVETRERVRIAGSGQIVERHDSYGIQVTLDVNNRALRPLGDADIEGVIKRATSLWPAKLITFLNGRVRS